MLTSGSSRTDHRVVAFVNPVEPGQYTLAVLDSRSPRALRSPCWEQRSWTSVERGKSWEAVAKAHAAMAVTTSIFR